MESRPLLSIFVFSLRNQHQSSSDSIFKFSTEGKPSDGDVVPFFALPRVDCGADESTSAIASPVLMPSEAIKYLYVYYTHTALAIMAAIQSLQCFLALKLNALQLALLGGTAHTGNNNIMYVK